MTHKPGNVLAFSGEKPSQIGKNIPFLSNKWDFIPVKLDDPEKEILAALQEDARMTNAELARRVKLVGVALLSARQGAREVRGDPALRGAARPAQGGPARDGLRGGDHGAPVRRGHGETLARVRDEPHIIECHALSGSYDYLMKVVARNMDHFLGPVHPQDPEVPRRVQCAIQLQPRRGEGGRPAHMRSWPEREGRRRGEGEEEGGERARPTSRRA